MRKQVVKLVRKKDLEQIIIHTMAKLYIYNDKYPKFSILENSEYSFLLGEMAFNRLYKKTFDGRMRGEVDFYFYISKKNQTIDINMTYNDESGEEYCNNNIISFNHKESQVQKVIEKIIQTIEEINKNQDLVELRWKGN